MPLTLNEQAQQISNPQLIARTAAALVKSALAVMAEDANTKGHAERAAWASAVLANPETWARRAVWSIVSNPNAGSQSKDDPILTTAASHDSALEFILNSVWNAYAGYSPAAAPMGAAAIRPTDPVGPIDAPPACRLGALRRFWRWLFFSPDSRAG